MKIGIVNIDHAAVEIGGIDLRRAVRVSCHSDSLVHRAGTRIIDDDRCIRSGKALGPGGNRAVFGGHQKISPSVTAAIRDDKRVTIVEDETGWSAGTTSGRRNIDRGRTRSPL